MPHGDLTSSPSLCPFLIQAASARRERRMERRQRDSLVGLFEGDEEGEEEGGEVDFAAIGSGLEGKVSDGGRVGGREGK